MTRSGRTFLIGIVLSWAAVFWIGSALLDLYRMTG